MDFVHLAKKGSLKMNELSAQEHTRPAGHVAMALFDHYPDAVLILNADGSVHASNAAAQWLGHDGRFPSFGEMTGLPWTQSQHLPLNAERAWSRRLRVTSGSGLTKQMESTIVIVPAEESEPLRCLCILRDSAPELQAARATHHTESRARMSTEAAPVMIWMAGPDMRCDWFNKSWLAFTGRTLGQEAGDGWTEGIHPEDMERCLGIYAVSLEARAPFTLDYRHRRHDGVYRWLLAVGIPRHGVSGTFEGYVGSCLDIHDRKGLEDRLADHTRALRLMDRRREDFLALLSHELRNPLAPIANAAALLRLQEDGNPKLTLIREIVERQVEQLRRLITDLVDVSRITKGRIVLERERVVIAEVMHAATESLRARSDSAGQFLHLVEPDERVVCLGDRARIVQALENLVGNAIKFSNRGDTIEVSADVSDSQVAIRVKDYGQGIRPEFMPRLFELFAQDQQNIARTPGGLGAGLTISKRIAELHGGDVQALSDGPGQGSEFVLSLPKLGAEPVLEQVDLADLSSLHTQRVLVIEDNTDMRESTKLLLEASDNDVRCARDAREAMLQLDSFIPQVVVCDIGLPDLDGFQLIGRLRDRLAGHSVFFVALTGYGRDTDRDQALDSGFDAFTVKPVRTAQHLPP
jgi:PAS domain S-box-containing protein